MVHGEVVGLMNGECSSGGGSSSSSSTAALVVIVVPHKNETHNSKNIQLMAQGPCSKNHILVSTFLSPIPLWEKHQSLKAISSVPVLNTTVDCIHTEKSVSICSRAIK